MIVPSYCGNFILRLAATVPTPVYSPEPYLYIRLWYSHALPPMTGLASQRLCLEHLLVSPSRGIIFHCANGMCDWRLRFLACKTLRTQDKTCRALFNTRGDCLYCIESRLKPLRTFYTV